MRGVSRTIVIAGWLAAVGSCTTSPPPPRPELFQPAPASGGVSGIGGQTFVPLPIEDIPPKSRFPTCEELTVYWAEGCAGTTRDIATECVHVSSLQPIGECDGEPFGFGGAPAPGTAGEGGGAGQGGEQGQAVHGSRCPTYYPGGCRSTVCVDQARLFPDGSAECCYGLEQLFCQ